MLSPRWQHFSFQDILQLAIVRLFRNMHRFQLLRFHAAHREIERNALDSRMGRDVKLPCPDTEREGCGFAE